MTQWEKIQLKLKKCTLLGITALSLVAGLSAAQTNADAHVTYQSVPRTIRGYYISRPGNSALTITKHQIVTSIPQADWYNWHVRFVTYNNHYYHVHTYQDMGQSYYSTFKLHRYAKNKFTTRGFAYHKVSASTISYFVNHSNPFSVVDN